MKTEEIIVRLPWIKTELFGAIVVAGLQLRLPQHGME
jgi:hypothetical protein